jgi:hypothetical protein
LKFEILHFFGIIISLYGEISPLEKKKKRLILNHTAYKFFFGNIGKLCEISPRKPPRNRGWKGPYEEGKAFVVVPRFVLDEMFGLMAVVFLFFFKILGWWGVCLGGPAGGVHVLSNSLVVMSLKFYSLGPSCGFFFSILKKSISDVGTYVFLNFF